MKWNLEDEKAFKRPRRRGLGLPNIQEQVSKGSGKGTNMGKTREEFRLPGM